MCVYYIAYINNYHMNYQMPSTKIYCLIAHIVNIRTLFKSSWHSADSNLV